MLKLALRYGVLARKTPKAGAIAVFCIALCTAFGITTTVPVSATTVATRSTKSTSLCTTYASVLKKQDAIATGTSSLSKAYIAANKSGSWPAIQKANVAEFKEFANLDKSLGSALSGAPNSVKSAQSMIIKFADAQTAAAVGSTSSKQFNNKLKRAGNAAKLTPANNTVTAFVTRECPGEVPTTTP
jgi:hypothetical protein